MNKIFVFLFLFLLGSLSSNAEQLVDEVANKLPRAVAQPVVYKDYDYEPTVKIPVKLKPVQNIKSIKYASNGYTLHKKEIENENS